MTSSQFDSTGQLPDETPSRLIEVVHRTWIQPLQPAMPQLRTIAGYLQQENAAGRGYLPPAAKILNAFSYPFDQVKVLIVGQDPYPTPGHSMGLAFSVRPEVQPLPKSLVNIFLELHDDTGLSIPNNGDLTPWASQGVLLLNRVLTVTPGKPGSHQKQGWEQFTQLAIAALVARERPLVAVLWGKQAQSLSSLLTDVPIISSAHPSPLSAYRGFFGSRPFSRTNELLVAQGAPPIDWSV